MAPDEAPGPRAWTEYLHDQRWFAGKGRPVVSVDLWDRIEAERAPVPWGYRLIEVGYSSGLPERYALGLPAQGGSGSERSPIEAAQTPARVRALLDAIAEGRTLAGMHGTLTCALDEGGRPLTAGDVEDAAIVPVTQEQSNRSTRVGDRWMLKEYRQLQPGPNPDRELPRALIRAGFDRVPRPVGGAVYRRRGVGAIDLISVTEFVPNRGDAWTVWGHWLREAEPHRVDAVLGREAEAIGRLTGSLHRALARISEAAFAAEAPTGSDLERRRERWQERNDLAGHRLSEARPRLPAGLADRIARIDGWPQRLLPLARILAETARSGVRPMRIHGDYHLGQLLRAEDGYFVLDFEGEPAHTIAERRSVDWAAKDVAGMIRSIDYRLRAGPSGSAATPGLLSPSDRALRDRIIARFLRAYEHEIGRGPDGIQPEGAAATAALVRYYSIEKLCYELLYELDHRPAWLGIPLAALEEILEQPVVG